MKMLRNLLNVGSVIIIKLIMVLDIVRDHCHIIIKYRVSAHRDCSINLKLNGNIPAVFHNLKNYDSHLIMKKLEKFNLKKKFIPNGPEKYISFTVRNKLSFTESFQFLSSSLDSLVKNLSQDDFQSRIW